MKLGALGCEEDNYLGEGREDAGGEFNEPGNFITKREQFVTVIKKKVCITALASSDLCFTV